MDFTINMMDGGRAIPASQATAIAMGQVPSYQSHQAHPNTNHHTTAHLIPVNTGHQQHQVTVGVQHQQDHNQHQQQQQQQQQQHHQQQQSLHTNMHEEEPNLSEPKPPEIAKDENEVAAFTPPPRVASVCSVASHSDTRVEKGTDTNDFEPMIKVEIRGHVPGLTAAEKDKSNVMQLHFNSVNEVVHYFSQRSSVQQLDAFNFLANPEIVRNINPDLMRNHFLYVPNSQETVRVANGFATTMPNGTQVTQTQGATVSPIVIAQPAPTPKVRPMKTERRRGEVPPGTIINKTPAIEANPNQFVCWICGLNLQKSLPFEEHMVETHSIEKPYRCEDCGVTFKQKAHIDRHRRIHLPTRPYQCGVCGKGFTRNEHVRRHSFTHSGEKPYQCPSCNKSFSRQQQLTKHMATHTKPPRADSPQPGTHHVGGLTTALLLQTTDQNGGRFVAINQGGVPMATTVTTQQNVVTQAAHTNSRNRQANGESRPRPYQCGVCAKAFVRNEHLRRHLLIHSGEKPHVCATCGKAFPRREHLTKHMRCHNKDHQQGSSISQAIQAVTVASGISQVSHPTVTSVPAGVSASGHQPTAAHSGTVTHSVHASHVPTSHSSLPPGTHYLPMLGFLAEVV